ncbi:MAG TPA: 16S rRNA (guanine(527)-N(7))-methyltransferase RsmG [Alphaproteobacteria bacterium]|nr:16S rRNA (guanine(527)-N(7))-methyltransferase RsmG [Alphaproteobacteria bacterium]
MLPRSPELQNKLSLYKTLLLKWSKAINLVSPSTLQDIDSRHFEDSLQIEPLLPSGAKVLFDFGSGAGFPALVLAMAREDLEVHVFESDQKKCAFMGSVSRETFIPVIIHNERVEHVDIQKLPKPDVVTARALSSLKSLLDMAQRWWESNEDLLLIFPKGEKSEAEILEAREFFSFDLEEFPSSTDSRSKILRIRHVQTIEKTN